MSWNSRAQTGVLSLSAILCAAGCGGPKYHTIWERYSEHCVADSPYYIEHEVHNKAPPGLQSLRFTTVLVQDSICLECPPGQQRRLPRGVTGAAYIPGMIDITQPYKITAHGKGCKGDVEKIIITYSPGSDTCTWKPNKRWFEGWFSTNCDEQLAQYALTLVRQAQSGVQCIAPKMIDNCPTCRDP